MQPGQAPTSFGLRHRVIVSVETWVGMEFGALKLIAKGVLGSICPDDGIHEWRGWDKKTMVGPEPRANVPEQVLTQTTRTYLDRFLTKAGPASEEQWVPGEETIASLEASKVLLVKYGILSSLPLNDTGSCTFIQLRT